jgi:hypothetical protein
MKPNELMIGDWMWFTDPDTQETDPVKIEKEDIGYDGDDFWQLFRPIQITPEILIANGFLPTNQSNSIWRKDFDEVNYRIKIDFQSNERMKILVAENSTNYNYLSIHSSFVHSIQQALRLAGLAELADNFVIEKGGQQ